MSEEIAKLIDKEIENKRVVAWGGFGKQLYHSEILFQVRAQEIISLLISPTKENIIESEQALATVKKEYKKLQDDRIAVTSKFDPVIARCMEPEKSILAAIEVNQSGLLKAKQEEKDLQKLLDLKAKEVRHVAEYVRVYVADMHAAYLLAHAKLLSTAYEHALSISLSMEDLPTYIQKVCARINVSNTTTPKPSPPFQYNSKEDVDTEIEKHFNPWPSQKYIDGFALDVAKKFSDWELALKNKETAKQLNENETKQNLDAINDQKQSETVAAKLDAIAVPMSGTPAGKPLKETYKLKEPETMDDADIIIIAYAVHRAACRDKIRKIAPINFGVKQMIAALESLKNDDENFSFTGLIFTKIEKL